VSFEPEVRDLGALAAATRWLFSLCLPLLLLTASSGWAANSLWLYKAGFDKYRVGQTTGLSQPELEKAARGLMGYFNSGEEYISLTAVKDGESFQLFSQREVIHLKDVKGLIRLDYWVLLGTLVYALAYAGTDFFWHRRGRWWQLARGLVWGSGITLALMLAFGLGTLLIFDQLFLRFHLLSFANDFWQLDPSRDYLIMLFPQGFWYDAALLVAGTTTGLALILGGIGGGYLLRSRISAASED
jgi:integral membrane protein (TIGR01906 family)